MHNLKDFFSKYNSLLPMPVSGHVTEKEANYRATEFLVALAQIADFRSIYGEDHIKNTSVLATVYALTMGQQSAKTVTENKMNAEATKEYVDAREASERTELEISQLKLMTEIYSNAHIFYRGKAKGE
jgi:hypothetical protein